MQDILTLRSEVRHLSLVARQLEPYVRSLGAERLTPSESSHPCSQGATPDSAAVSGLTSSLSTLTSLEPHLQSLLDRINLLQMEQDAR
jgi:hypothetical protein